MFLNYRFLSGISILIYYINNVFCFISIIYIQFCSNLLDFIVHFHQEYRFCLSQHRITDSNPLFIAVASGISTFEMNGKISTVIQSFTYNFFSNYHINVDSQNQYLFDNYNKIVSKCCNFQYNSIIYVQFCSKPLIIINFYFNYQICSN